MAPLYVEVFNPARNRWSEVGDVKPTDRPGSLSDNKPDGSRDVYLFKCEQDDSKSTLYRSTGGVDIASPGVREIIYEELEVVKELRIYESHELSVKPDRSPQSVLFRFTHR